MLICIPFLVTRSSLDPGAIFLCMTMRIFRRDHLHRAPPLQIQFLRLISSISATTVTPWYTAPPSSPNHQDIDPLLTALSQAITNTSNPLETSVRKLLPSLKPYHIIDLININPHSLDPQVLLSFFKWLSTQPPFRHTIQSYFAMIKFLSAHQMFPEAESLLRFVVSRKGKHSAGSVFQAFIETKGTQHNDFVFDALLNCYVDNEFISDAIQCFRLAKVQNFRILLQSCRRVLDYLMKSNSNSTAWGFYLEVLGCGYPPDIYTFNNLMHKFSKEGMINDAKMVFDEIPKWGLRPSLVSFNTLLNGYCKSGKLDEGFRIKKVIEESTLAPDVFTYSVLINALCKESKLVTAYQLFDEMSRRGLHPNDVIFTTLINGLCRNGKTNLAMQMYSKMVVRGIKADLITFNTLINGLCKSGKINEARNLIDEITRVGLTPDKITYTCLLDGCFKEGDLQLALVVKEKMVKEGIELDNVTFTALISGLCREGLVVNAEKLLREMTKLGLKPNDATYTMVIDGFCKKGDVKMGFQLLKEMRRDGIVPGIITYNVLMNGLCKLGQMKNANKLLKSMLDLGVFPDDITYNILLEGHCKYGDVEVLEKLRSEKGVIYDYASYISLVEGSIKTSKHHQKR
ncbi:hypothetical protein L2E82_34335 [Cichorium intybus]|uniref:Uncharacterized protein n=1 Tax=Cichorium intybus TaxID=13427 RepID=A0ACB9BLY0_CICIN|nr:hypothetical protein L2E82_34335 [Cichorium intybus]